MNTSLQRKFVSIFLACSLIPLLASCSGTGGTAQSTASTTAATTAAQDQSATTTAQAAPDPITLKIGIQSANSTIGDGIHQEYSVLKNITDQTGVTLDFVTYDTEKFRVLVAGGDLPDIISTEVNSGSSVVSTLIESGALLPLDDLLNSYGQNIQKNIPVGLTWSKDVIGNGKTFILPTNTSAADTANPKQLGWVGFFTRYDIYKAIGAPAISGEDSYLQVLKQMQDYERKKTGNNKVYALSSWSDWGLWPYWVSYPFVYGYNSSNYNHLVNMDTGAIEHQFLDADGVFWKGLKFLNKAYQMGIFDPEGLTMKYAQYVDKCINGTLLTVGANWIQPDVKICGDKAINVVLPGAFPVVSQLYTMETKTGYREGGARCINVNCKYPERAMQLLNWFDSEDGARILANGVKGVDWDVVDGKAQLIGDRLKAYQTNTLNEFEQAHPSGIAGANFVSMAQFYTSGSFATSDGEPISLSTSQSFLASVATDLQKSFAHDFDANLSYPGQVYDKWVKDGTEKSPVNTPLAAEIVKPISTANGQVESQAAEYFTSNISKAIMAKNDAAFDSVKASMIAAVKSMGVDKSNEEFMKLYEEAKKLAETLK